MHTYIYIYIYIYIYVYIYIYIYGNLRLAGLRIVLVRISYKQCTLGVLAYCAFLFFPDTNLDGGRVLISGDGWSFQGNRGNFCPSHCFCLVGVTRKGITVCRTGSGDQ